MKHFKLNIVNTFTPVADLCITGIPTKDYISVIRDFTKTLNNYQINFDIIEKENQMMVAKKKEVSWSISE